MQQCAVTVLAAVGSFAVVAGLMTIVPGLDTALVVRTAIAQGRRRGLAAALGINTGILIWGIAAAAGVSALLVASRLAYDAVRLLGAGYLTWLGATMLWRTWRGRGNGRVNAAAARRSASGPQGGPWWTWYRGAATNLLNPKIGVFYLAMLPQFIPARSPHLLIGLVLAGVHDMEGMAWFTVLISAAHRTRRYLDSDRVHKVVDLVTGTVLLGFGLKLALSKR
jgi:threonine/homoserine/homoserine lactone efflux protein